MSTQSPTIAQYRLFVNQLSPNLKDFNFYNAKKGDKISITCSSSNSILQCEFVKYEIVELKQQTAYLKVDVATYLNEVTRLSDLQKKTYYSKQNWKKATFISGSSALGLLLFIILL